MAHKVDPKTPGFFHRIESMATGEVQKFARDWVVSALRSLRKNHPMLWYKLGYVFWNKEQEEQRVAETFIRAMLLPFEWLLDKAPVPFIVTHLGTDALAAVATQAAEYYKRLNDGPGKFEDHPENYPEGFAPPSMDDVQQAFSQASGLIFRRFPSMQLGRLLDKINTARVIEALGLGKSDLILGAIIQLEPKDYRRLTRVSRRWTEQERHEFTRLDKILGEVTMLTKFVRMTPAQREEFLKDTKANQLRLLSPDHEKELKEWCREASRRAKQHLQDAADATERWSRGVHRSNTRRAKQLDQERFSVPNLVKYQWRLDELRKKNPTDLRLFQAEAELERRRFRFSRLASWRYLRPAYAVAAMAIVIFMVTALVGYVQQLNNEPPAISIWQPTGGTFTAAPTILGQAEDKDQVVRIEVQSNNGPKQQLFVFPGYRANINWTPDVVQAGWNSVLFWVSDSKNATQMTKVMFRIEPPAHREFEAEPFPVDTIVPGIGG